MYRLELWEAMRLCSRLEGKKYGCLFCELRIYLEAATLTRATRVRWVPESL
jgi:hypothetical protein